MAAPPPRSCPTTSSSADQAPIMVARVEASTRPTETLYPAAEEGLLDDMDEDEDWFRASRMAVVVVVELWWGWA
jgi:hypothetical protein